MHNNDVYVLDSFDTIYIWVGYRSNKYELKGAHAKVKRYIEGVTDGRNKGEVDIREVDAGREPPDFTVQFIQWEPEVAQAWLDDDPMAKMRKEFESAAELQAKEDARDPFEGFLNPKTTTFTYEEIKGKWPANIKGD